MIPPKSSVAILLFVSGMVFASCGVDTDGLVFDDQQFDDLKTSASGDDDGNGGSSGDTDSGKGDSSGDGDGDGGDGGTSGTGTDNSGAGGQSMETPECVMVGELRCDGKQVQVCTGSIFIDAGGECEFVCIDGACDGNCAPGLTECVSETEQRSCSTKGKWGEPSQCKHVCSGNACGGACRPGERSCDPDDPTGHTKRLCSSAGNWDSAGSCSVGECADGGCTACSTDETQCTADSKGVQTCVDGTFSEPSDCRDQVCIDGTCQGDCRPALGGDAPQRKCVPGSPSVQLGICGSNGKFAEPVTCDFVCVEGSNPGRNDACGGTCKPGARRCDKDVLVECATDGQREVKVEDCSSNGESCLPVTVDGELGCGVCTPGTAKDPNLRCNARSLEACVKGQWSKSKDCSEGSTKSSVGLCYNEECVVSPELCAGLIAPRYSGCFDASSSWQCTSALLDADKIAVTECPNGCALTSCN